jgi:hypothetical protein
MQFEPYPKRSCANLRPLIVEVKELACEIIVIHGPCNLMVANLLEISWTWTLDLDSLRG